MHNQKSENTLHLCNSLVSKSGFADEQCARLRPISGMMPKNKKVREQIKSRAGKIGKFRFKMNFGLDSGSCRDVGVSHSLCLNELLQLFCFVMKDSLVITSRLFVSSAARRATLSTAIKADDLGRRVSPRRAYHGAIGGIAEINCFSSFEVTPTVMMARSFFISQFCLN